MLIGLTVAYGQQPATVRISWNPASITVGQSATLTWSAVGATSCLAGAVSSGTGNPYVGWWGGPQPASGTQTITQGSAGTYVDVLSCTSIGGSASASATLTVISSGSTPTITEAITSLPADITPMLSVAGIWQPVSNQYVRLDGSLTGNPGGDGNGSLAGIFAQNILLPNGREGLVAAGWSCCDARTSDNIAPAGIPITPVNIAILEQQQDGTLQLATSKYVSDSQTNGVGRVLVGDFNQDGIQDFFLPAYNESPFLPASSTAYVSKADGTYAKIAVGDFVEGHGGTVASVNGTPTVFVVGYSANCSYLVCIPNAYAWNGSNGFTIVPQTGMQTAASTAVGDFYADGTYSAVYGDVNAGVNLPNVPNWVNGIYLYQLSSLIPVGNPVNVGDPYFNDKPQWAQYVGYVNPHGETHSYNTFLDDFNHDGKLDVIVQGSIYPSAPNGGPNILQMFENNGSYQFTDVTDLLNSHYDPYTAESDYDPQVRDIDGSGVNSYLLMSPAGRDVNASNYLILNDGSGDLQIALHETLNKYGQQVDAWLESLPSFAAYDPTSYPQPDLRAYETANGKLNFVAIVWIRSPAETATVYPTLEQYVFVNIPLQLDLSSQFTKPIVVQNRNGSHLIRTFAGNDTIYSGNNGGYSKVDGGLGTNTVVYSGPSHNYSAAKNADATWTIKDNVGTDGIDTLTRIQRLQFTDIVVNLASPTTPGPAASIAATAGGGQSAAVNTAFSPPLQVTVRDFLGNLVPNVAVAFTAPSSGASGTFPGSVLTASATTNTSGVATAPACTANGTIGAFTLTATVAGVAVPASFSLTNTPVAPALLSGTLANGATYLAGGLVPGSWAQVKGTNLSTTARIWAASDFTGLGNNLPTNLSGVQVNVNNQPAAVYYISPAQISFQVPAGITGAASVQVITNSQTSNSVNAAAATSSPGIFPVILGGTNYAAAVFLDGKIAADPSNGSAFRNAVPGDAVQLFATGLAPSPAGTLISTTFLSGVTVTIGTITVPADATALVAVGEFQVNFTVPQSFASLPAGLYPISISVNGVTSPASINSSPPGPIVIPIQP